MSTLPAAMYPAKACNGRTNSPLPSPTKSPRRVLGELAPNRQITPNTLEWGAKPPVKTMPTNSPLRAQEAFPKATTLSIEENGDVSRLGSSKKRPLSAITSPERPDATRRAAKRQQEAGLQTVSPAALRSPLPPSLPVLELPYQDSSTDSDSQPSSPKEHDNPTTELLLGTQRTHGSFSSLIDYNPDNASDRSDAASVSPPSTTRREACIIPVTSHVELLKLRLKMAMYKLNTNQTLVPFAKLEPPHARAAETDEVDAEQEDEVEDALFVSPGDGREGSAASEEARGAHLIRENIVIKGGPVARLLDGPVLAPTAYSTRFLSAPDAGEQRRTPVASPSRRYVRDERELTSSVVKGHAASGLLELAHSR